MHTVSAQELAATANTWHVEPAYRIPSRTRPGLRYLVTATSCSCIAFTTNGYTSCAHIEAVRLVQAVVEPPCQDLELVSLPSGELAWLRAEDR